MSKYWVMQTPYQVLLKYLLSLLNFFSVVSQVSCLQTSRRQPDFATYLLNEFDGCAGVDKDNGILTCSPSSCGTTASAWYLCIDKDYHILDRDYYRAIHKRCDASEWTSPP